MEFNYQAKDHEGKLVAGVVDAPSKDQAVSVLHRKSLTVITVESIEDGLMAKDIGGFFSRPNRKDVIIFTRQLSTLIDADMPLLQSLQTMVEQVEKESFRKVIENIIVSIEGGASLSISLSEHPNVFDDFFVNLVKVGEVSGKLQSTLLYLADHLERSAEITSKIRGALMYPLFVLGAMVLVITLMMTSVIPQLLTIVEDAGVEELPLATRILITVTDFINNNFIVLLLLLIVGIVLLYHYVHTQSGKAIFDAFKINVPKFGMIARHLYISRISETLSTLINAGVPILESLNITADVVGNEVYKKVLNDAEANVRGGGSISETIQESYAFPRLVGSMIATGEKTGRLDFMLKNVLKFFQSEAEESIKNISQLIEPILILLLGLGVGILVAAVLLPIYSLVGAQ